ncbi:MAG: hypothetical protein KA486_06785 [Flavobacterium sp.]|nr:hypothetical protein [Flavobacterium sp.]
MKTVNTLQFKIYLIVFNLMSIAVNAEDDPGFPDESDPGQDPAALINDWILPMAIVGILMMYYFIRKKKQSLV